MENKKIKRSITGIAVILLICGHYSIQHPADDIRSKNTEVKVDLLHPRIETKVQQDEIFCDDIKFVEANN